MGDKLRKNNPAITNLNDPNRPMKLGDQFSELYENEWTDAFTDIGSTNNLSERGGMLEDQERRIIEDLLDILQASWSLFSETYAPEIMQSPGLVSPFSIL